MTATTRKGSAMFRTALAPAALVVIAGLVSGCMSGGGGGTDAAAPSAVASTAVATEVPTFDLVLDGVVDLPAYASDRAASLNTCAQSDSGGWSYLYGGGSPFMTLELSIFSGVISGTNPADFNLDVDTQGSVVRVVPSGRREGPKGTGAASIVSTADEVVITIEGSSITRRGSAVDHGATDVALTVHCPIANAPTP